ncbi:MAG: S-adenosylmethionine:tRNA ribosyltransferase-isomerase [Candidatus Competibacteraceae bacterium]|nr:S-adenosylmethionine:tRNA ribosyltransferase-isomerase [Candidatus Competibacteraceae bacterium]
MFIPEIDMQQYLYDLPESCIAPFPVSPRDASRLLYYDGGVVSHHHFYELPDILSDSCMFIANQSRVIPARIILHKSTGAKVEIFLLEPANGKTLEEALHSYSQVEWKVMVGNKKKWHEGERLFFTNGYVQWINRDTDIVRFIWSDAPNFATLLDLTGTTPIPPYIKRDSSESDRDFYQTVYAQEKGSVAAPTAGLHFTSKVLQHLQNQGHSIYYITLHVGAGTFKPVSATYASQHIMHSEPIRFSRDLIEQIMHNKRPVMAVGTTSLRSLESLYWFGVGLFSGRLSSFDIPQFFPYDSHPEISIKQSLQVVLNFMHHHSLNDLDGKTSLFIMPGYRFKMINGLITNFHQPGSTLLLLIAALIGDDWKNVYAQAMHHGYRFLSYGDSSLLLPKK